MATSAARSNVLLVEDDEGLREAFRDLFEDEGFNVWTASNGREALECLRSRGRACLIVLDLMMPVMNGWEFRGEQMGDPELATIPVVVCTADPRAAKNRAAFGAAAWLSKPTDAADLVRIANRFCRPDTV
jgi:CheY-like chemotaxis protein